jgi:hypothetical protein
MLTGQSVQYLVPAVCFYPTVTSVNGLSWYWITLAATVPPIMAVLVAYAFWRGGQNTFGNIVGTAVLFASALGLILREYVDLDRLTNECLDAGTTCFPQPSAFTRFAVYAFIALIEVFALFWLGLFIEERVRRRSYSREWQ